MSKKTIKKDSANENDNEIVTKKEVRELSEFESIIASAPNTPIIGDLIEGTVVDIERGRLYVDVAPFGTAIIYGKEYLSARDILRNVHIGDTISAKVVNTENENGYIEVSLKEARQALSWSEAESAKNEKKVLELVIGEANKGGLIVEWNGIQGFLPSSQLAPEYYPRVQDGDKDAIFAKLKELTGKTMPLMVITSDAKEQKLIFSGKISERGAHDGATGRFAVGDTINGTVTGSTDFGIFIKIDDGLEGLVHISEMDWGLVDNARNRYKVGEIVPVKIIDLKDGKVSLSIKALIEDPWKSAGEKYTKDQKVNAVVIKFNKHGALAALEAGVSGLVHISEFGSEEKMKQALSLGCSYPFVLSVFEPKEHRMTLTYGGEKK